MSETLPQLYHDTWAIHVRLGDGEKLELQGKQGPGQAWNEVNHPENWRFLRIKPAEKTPEQIRVERNLALKAELGSDGWRLCEYREKYNQPEFGPWRTPGSWIGADKEEWEFRRKPAPAYVPFSFEDELCGKVMSCGTARCSVLRQEDDGLWVIGGDGDPAFFSYSDALQVWTIDGLPAGKEASGAG